MIIKVEMIIDWLPKADNHYDEPIDRTKILLNEIISNLEFDGLFKVVYSEVNETNHE